MFHFPWCWWYGNVTTMGGVEGSCMKRMRLEWNVGKFTGSTTEEGKDFSKNERKSEKKREGFKETIKHVRC